MSSSSLYKRLLRSLPKTKTEFEKNKISFFLVAFIVFMAGVIIFKITFGAYQYVTNFTLNDLIGIFSTRLQQDDKEKTTVLLLGTGGGEHEGPDLTDTIMLVSLNQKKSSVSLLSIPRDLWLDLPNFSGNRINKIYELLKDKYGSIQALTLLRQGIENITNVKIPYVIKIDFSAFTKAIDLVNGVEIMVEKSIYDTEYPNEKESGYTTFSLEAGKQILDGKTALKYVRSRHSTSDFDRSARQQKVLRALLEKTETIDILKSPILIKKLYDEFSLNVETNMSISELISMARFVKSLDSKQIVNAILKDTEIIGQGSFLYTPERELYGGAFVLMPISDTYQSIQRFIAMLFDMPEFFQEQASMEILNGTRHYGLASQIGDQLIPYGWNVKRYGNAKKPGNKIIQQTSYFIRNSERAKFAEEVISLFFPKALKLKKSLSDHSSDEYDITLIVGEDSYQEP